MSDVVLHPHEVYAIYFSIGWILVLITCVDIYIGCYIIVLLLIITASIVVAVALCLRFHDMTATLSPVTRPVLMEPRPTKQQLPLFILHKNTPLQVPPAA